MTWHVLYLKLLYGVSISLPLSLPVSMERQMEQNLDKKPTTIPLHTGQMHANHQSTVQLLVLQCTTSVTMYY